MYMHERFVWSAVHVICLRKLREKNGVGMALDVATLPLILYRNITIEHVLHCENIIHIPIYLVLLLCHSYSIFFHFQCFFYLFMPFFHYIVIV